MTLTATTRKIVYVVGVVAAVITGGTAIIAPDIATSAGTTGDTIVSALTAIIAAAAPLLALRNLTPDQPEEPPALGDLPDAS